MNFKTITKITQFVSPELLHNFFLMFLQTKLYKKVIQYNNLEIQVFDKKFKNPLGLAAGFDKNAEVIQGIYNLGFGFSEFGTVTPMPQLGNKKPRVFKIPEFEAVIQRLGFNNEGVEQFIENLEKSNRLNKILGVNIGKNKNTDNLFSDYSFLYKKLEPYADYITINISSPNTPGLRNLQEKGNIEKLLIELSKIKKRKPTLLKLSPDISRKNLENICNLIMKDNVIEGLIMTNTTISRKELLTRPIKNSWKVMEDGGLSGPPLKNKTNALIKDVYKLTYGKKPIIGVGGISNGRDAFEKISFGASLVQLYTSLIYRGPGVVFSILSELSILLEKKGLTNVSQLVGKNISYE